jgi:hypothetical protein
MTPTNQLIILQLVITSAQVLSISPIRTLIPSIRAPPARDLKESFVLSRTRGGAILDEVDQDLEKISFLTTRGGAILEEHDEDDEDVDEDDGEFDGLFGLDEEGFEIAEDDFAEENTLSRMLVAWEKTPPLTKSFLTASFAATAYGYLFNKNEFPKVLLMDWKATLTRLQLWRPITAFLNVGPFGLAYAMTAHFVWTYMSTLERLNHDRPYDFWIMIAFGCISMVVGYGFLGLSPRFLGHNLSTFLVYIWSRYHEGLEVNMFELFNTKAELLPWFFLAQTFLLEGELPVLDFLGIVFGHIYHHCKTIGLLRAPQFLVDWYKSDAAAGLRRRYKEISADFEMQ